MGLRKWGFPVVRYLLGPDGQPAPVAEETRSHEPPADPDETPRASGVFTPGLAAEDSAAIVERLDVPPETRPWDVATEPTVAPSGPSGISLAVPPHCDGRHGDGHPTKLGGGRRCEWCDALTSWISAHKALERRIAELERRVADLVAHADQREIKERQS